MNYIKENNSYEFQSSKDNKRRCINIEDLTGRTFSRLKVIERDYTKRHKSAEYYRCECRCGNKNYITTAKNYWLERGVMRLY